MKTLTTSELSENIKRSLGINPRSENYLLESYVAQEKTFNLPTEFLSEANKNNHIELYSHQLQQKQLPYLHYR